MMLASREKSWIEETEDVFNGLYDFCAPYCPHLKPIEKGFSNVKGWIREHEDEALSHPVQFLNEAFELYSVTGARKSEGMCERLRLLEFII